jgi:hypothetical protein
MIYSDSGSNFQFSMDDLDDPAPPPTPTSGQQQEPLVDPPLSPNQASRPLRTSMWTQQDEMDAFFDQDLESSPVWNEDKGQSTNVPDESRRQGVRAIVAAKQGQWTAYYIQEPTDHGVNLYYYNEQTRQSTWEKPTPTFPEVWVDAVTTQPILLAREGDWSLYVAPPPALTISGETSDNLIPYYFYYNRQTGVSQWDRPSTVYFDQFEIDRSIENMSSKTVLVDADNWEKDKAGKTATKISSTALVVEASDWEQLEAEAPAMSSYGGKWEESKVEKGVGATKSSSTTTVITKADAWEEEMERETSGTTISNAVGAEMGAWKVDEESEQGRESPMAVALKGNAWEEETDRQTSNTTSWNAVGAETGEWQVDKESTEERASPMAVLVKADAWDEEPERETSNTTSSNAAGAETVELEMDEQSEEGKETPMAVVVKADAWEEEIKRETSNTTPSNSVGAETSEWEVDNDSEGGIEATMAPSATLVVEANAWQEETEQETSNTTFSNAAGTNTGWWKANKQSGEMESKKSSTPSVVKADAWEMEMERETSKKSSSSSSSNGVEAKAGDSNEGKGRGATEVPSTTFAVESLSPGGLSSRKTVAGTREKRATLAASLSSYKIEERAVKMREASVASVPSYKIEERAPVFSWSAVLSRPGELEKEPNASNAPVPQQTEESKLDTPTTMHESTPTVFHQLHSVWQTWAEWSEHNKRLQAAKAAAKKKPSYGWLDFFVEVQTVNTTNIVP